MSRRSLRLRLLAMALLSIAAALLASGIALVALFERHVEARIDAELETYVRQIAGAVAFDPSGAFALTRAPADPRFEQPLSGLYWQIDDEASGQTLRSRSLWASRLALPPDSVDAAAAHRHLLPGPAGATLIARERAVAFPAGGAGRVLRIAVAADRADAQGAAQAFAGDLAPSLAVLGLALLAAAWLQVSVGLRPLEAMRREVGAIRSGARTRLPGDYPDEVRPLADEVNVLLAAQDKAIARARASAGDLAHGLNTPLAVLGADARSLRDSGQDEIAQDIDDLVATMKRHIERALAQARLRPGARSATEVAPLALRIVAALRKTPAGAGLSWRVEIPAGTQVAVDRDDLAELIGNIFENAAKFARTKVRASGRREGDTVLIAVEDDGPGIPEAARAAALKRGVRLDQATAGSGLGLAIAGDVLEACGGALMLEASATLGGLRAVIALPATAI